MPDILDNSNNPAYRTKRMFKQWCCKECWPGCLRRPGQRVRTYGKPLVGLLGSPGHYAGAGCGLSSRKEEVWFMDKHMISSADLGLSFCRATSYALGPLDESSLIEMAMQVEDGREFRLLVPGSLIYLHLWWRLMHSVRGRVLATPTKKIGRNACLGGELGVSVVFLGFPSRWVV